MTEETAVPKLPESKVERIAELVKRLCLALTNVEMFSVDHPLARKAIDAAYEWVQLIICDTDKPVVISVAGRKIVLDGVPLEDRNPLISKIAGKLEDLHIPNLFFEPGITPDEFLEFFGAIGQGPKAVNAAGGLPAMLREANVRHVTIKDVSYIMVTGDEKVVSRDAVVVDGTILPEQADTEIARYTVQKLLQKATEQKWLLDEMKNNPGKMAEMIIQGIDLAASRAEMGMEDEDGTVATLMQNIRLVGQALMDEQTGEVKDGEEDLERALVTLENEMRLRSSKLMSSKVAAGFVNEILAIVTAYSDQVRAKQISSEFLKGEAGLKRTEKLLRDLVPKTETVDKYIYRIREQLVRRGVSEKELEKLVARLGPKEEAKEAKKPKRPRKAYSQAVYDGVAKRAKELKLGEEQVKEFAESMSSFIEDKARERAGDIRREAEELKVAVERRNRILEDLPIGVVLWGGEGQTETANRAARDAVGEVPALGDPLRTALTSMTFPLNEAPDVTQHPGLTDADTRLLLVVSRVLTDEAGNLFGVLLLPPRGGGT